MTRTVKPVFSARLAYIFILFAIFGVMPAPCAFSAGGTEVIDLNGRMGNYDLRDYVEVLKDENYSIGQISSSAFAAKFSKPDADFYPGLDEKGYWLRFKVKADSNQANQIWRVAVTPPQTKLFTVFYPEFVKGKLSGWGRWDAGYENPRRSSWKGEDFLAFRLPLHEEATYYYIYYCAEDLNYNIFELVDENNFRESSRLRLLFFSFVIGFSGALILYNFFLFISLRDMSHLWYSLQCLSMNIYYFIVSDTVIEFIDIPIEYYIILNYFFLCLFIFLSTFFVESFLSNIRDERSINKVFIVLKTISFLSLVMSFFFGVEIMTLITGVLMIVFSITFILLGVLSYRNGFIAARLYLFAWSIFCFGLFLSSFCTITGFINLNYLVSIMQITNMFEMLFFSLALADRISVFRRDRQVAEVLSSAKSTFLATMSHEIRTPLNAIVGMSRVMLQSNLTPGQRKKLTIVRNSSDHLQRIINDILDFSRIEAGKLELEHVDFDLQEVINSVSDVIRLDVTEKGLNLSVEVDVNLPQALKGDPVRLRQILLNLLGNSVKFTESGDVSLKIEQLEDSLVRFTVVDTGIGISKELQENIFDKFAQADDSMNRRFGGTGLGLSICKQLVEMMKGTIVLHRTPEQGSTFIFEVPLEVGELQKMVQLDHPLKAMAVSAKPLNLLVAEDNMNNIELMKAVLNQTPHLVTYVYNGKSALEAVRNGNFDLVLMDLEMPEMNGLEAVKAVRGGYIGKDKSAIPIVALTAHALDEIRTQCVDVGMNGFISKPFKVDDLLMVISASVRSDTFLDISRDMVESTDKLPVFDEFGFRSMFGEDKELFNRIKNTFLEGLPTQIESMEVSIEQGDFVKLADDAHYLKTSAGVMSAGQMLYHTGNLEKAAQDKKLGDAKLSLALVKAAVGDLEFALQRL